MQLVQPSYPEAQKDQKTDPSSQETRIGRLNLDG
jgi:hypothetical protein